MLQDLNRIARQFASNPTIESNATITFTQISPSPGMTTDDYGNPIPLPEEKTVVTLECHLREKPLYKMETIEGVDENCTYFKGRLTNPKTYDFPLDSDSPIEVTINGRVGTAITEIRTLPTPTSQQYGVKDILGQRIALIVQFKQGN